MNKDDQSEENMGDEFPVDFGGSIDVSKRPVQSGDVALVFTKEGDLYVSLSNIDVKDLVNLEVTNRVFMATAAQLLVQEEELMFAAMNMASDAIKEFVLSDTGESHGRPN